MGQVKNIGKKSPCRRERAVLVLQGSAAGAGAGGGPPRTVRASASRRMLSPSSEARRKERRAARGFFDREAVLSGTDTGDDSDGGSSTEYDAEGDSAKKAGHCVKIASPVLSGDFINDAYTQVALIT